MLFGLKDEQLTKIKNALSSFGKIDEVIIFGSRAKGNFKPGSDIDLAIKSKDFSFDDLLKLHHTLDELNLPYKFDLLIYSSIKDKDVIEHINRAGVSIYKKSITD